MELITVSEHDKKEWSRMAVAAYQESKNPIVHRYSMAATLRHGEQMRIDIYDTLNGCADTLHDGLRGGSWLLNSMTNGSDWILSPLP